jgi:hypothetical protein
MAKHVDYKPGPPQRNQIIEAMDRMMADQNNPAGQRLLQLSKAYQNGGRVALRERFAKLYPDKVPPLPEKPEA